MAVRTATLLVGLVLHHRGGAAFQFLSIGDWGASAAKELNPIMGRTAPEFIVAIGDNMYSKGVSGINDPQFKDKFEDTFTAPSLNVTWYVTSGNHDYYGGEAGIKAEIEYTQHSTRWEFPDYYHEHEVTTKDGRCTGTTAFTVTALLLLTEAKMVTAHVLSML
eukprot:SAG11_NODE_134_length_15338_cov_3.876435_28_plen_163_part_00